MIEKDFKKVGENLRNIIKSSGMTASYVSSESGITQATMQNILNGKDFRYSTLLSIASVLGVPVETILKGQGTIKTKLHGAIDYNGFAFSLPGYTAGDSDKAFQIADDAMDFKAGSIVVGTLVSDVEIEGVYAIISDGRVVIRDCEPKGAIIMTSARSNNKIEYPDMSFNRAEIDAIYMIRREIRKV